MSEQLSFGIRHMGWWRYITWQLHYDVKTAAILDPPFLIEIFFLKRQQTTQNYCKVLKINKIVLKTRIKLKIIALKKSFINRNTKITNLGKHAYQNAVAMVMSSSWHNNLSAKLFPDKF